MSVRTEIADWLDERQARFISIANQIWEHPELALGERFAADLQANDLELDGFTITTGIGNLPTSFVAEYSHGSGGPIIGFLGEYDALPGLSQQRSDTQHEQEIGAAGHGCGHNLLGTASLAAAGVLKAWMIATNTPGTVRYYGCPAEETGEGKGFMAREGAFDDLDVAFSWHPGYANTATAGSSLADTSVRYRFTGRTAHAAANPETGRSALDAVELMNIGVNFLREHVPEKARIHYVITNGGGAPNVVPDLAESWYFIRSPERDQVVELTARVRKVAEGAALMTDTTLHVEELAGSYNLLPNRPIVYRLDDILGFLGPIRFDEADYAFARVIAETYPRSEREAALTKHGLPTSILDDGLSAKSWPILDDGEIMPASTDVADVSWIVPTGQVTTACFALGVPGHSWANTATAGVAIGHKGMLHAAKCLAIAAAECLTEPDLVIAAKEDFRKSTIDRPYVCPIPSDVQPRITATRS